MKKLHKLQKRLPERRRVRRSSRVYQYNPFSIGGYELPPNAREGLRKIVDNDLFWEYVEQIRVMEEKKRALNGYMDVILKRIQKEIKKKEKQ